MQTSQVFIRQFANTGGGTPTGQGYNIQARQFQGTVTFQLKADGDIESPNNAIQPISSERRLKDEITPIDKTVAWETIKSVPYYSFVYKDNPNTVRYGTIVDEVPEEMVRPTQLSDEEGPIRTYDNSMLQARLYTALQTALGRIEDLENRIATLENT